MSLISVDTPFSFIKIGGGLNDTGGVFDLQDNESPDLQNIDFDKFGSILPRYGYQVLNTVAIATTNACLGLYWLRVSLTSGGAYNTATYNIDPYATVVWQENSNKAIKVVLDKVYKMETLDGTWVDITQTGPKLSTATELPCVFITFNNKLLFTNDADIPKQWDTVKSITNMTVVTGLTQARFVTNFQNYCLMANCVVSGVDTPTRIYWSAFKNEASWNSADYVEVGYNDGQEIMGFKVLGDKLIVYKTKSIWFMSFTGNADIPFLVFKTNSAIGCVAPYSIQEIDKGHIFLSWDGLWYFDGLNSYKLSDKINNTLRSINRDRIVYAQSAYQFDKNRYLLSVASSTSTFNNLVVSLTYDPSQTTGSIFKAGKYSGISASSLAIFNLRGIEERLYFADYLGYTYRGDIGINDYPSNTPYAVNSYYNTNWKNFNDICDSKGIPHAYIYHSKTNGTLNFAYAYDFSTQDQYTHSFNMMTTQTVSDLGVRRDLTGRGRVVRFKFFNNATDTHYVIHGLGIQASLVSRA
jgi:hypothetical protein